MSLHSSLASAQTAAHFGHFADANRVSYTAKGGSPVNLSAIIGAITYEDRQRESGLVRMAVREITITNDPSSTYGGVAVPALNATATVDEESWSIAHISSPGGNLHTLRLEAPAAGEVLRNDYYGERQ